MWFSTPNNVFISVTKRTDDCILSPGTISLNCHGANVIYWIRCNRCHLQYVEKTIQELNAHVKRHKSG